MGYFQKRNFRSLGSFQKSVLIPFRNKMIALSLLLSGTMLSAYSQQGAKDSLLQIIGSASSSDSLKLAAYKDLIIQHYIYSSPDSAYIIAEKGLGLARSVQNKASEASFLNIQGVSLDFRGLKKEAFRYYEASLELREQLGDKFELGKSLINLGMAYMDIGELETALRLTQQALLNIQGNGDKILEADVLSNLAIIYQELGKLDIALEHFERVLEIYKNEGYLPGMATANTNLGISYRHLGNPRKALDYYKRGLEIRLEIGDEHVLANSYSNLAVVYHLNLNQYDSAEFYALKALEIAQKLGDPYKIFGPAKTLHQVYEQKGDYKRSLEMYKLYSLMNDSLQSYQLKNEIAVEKARAAFERQILLEEQAEREAAQLALEKEERRNTLQYSILLIGLIFLFVLVILSGKLKLSLRVTEGLIFFVFLLFFEFLLLFFDPFIENITNRAPAWMFILNSSIALIIFPLHNGFENIARKKLLAKKKTQ